VVAALRAAVLTAIHYDYYTLNSRKLRYFPRRFPAVIVEIADASQIC